LQAGGCCAAGGCGAGVASSRGCPRRLRIGARQAVEAAESKVLSGLGQPALACRWLAASVAAGWLGAGRLQPGREDAGVGGADAKHRRTNDTQPRASTPPPPQ